MSVTARYAHSDEDATVPSSRRSIDSRYRGGIDGRWSTSLPLGLDAGGKNDKLRQVSQFGGVAEWSKAAVLKTAVPKGTRGSNPFSSASRCGPSR
jgi:hypothetical protein